jgi:cytochrome c oxidase cbb3-type subunit I/II
VPYPEGYERQAADALRAQGAQIAAGLQRGGLQVSGDREIIALIAYLQRLGKDIKSGTETQALATLTPAHGAQ